MTSFSLGWLAALVLGAATGVLSGLFGVGGGFLLVPALALAGWPVASAVGTSLVYVAAVGAGGAWAHWRAGNMDLRIVLWTAVPAAVVTPLGATAAVHVPDAWLSVAFAAFLAVVVWHLRARDLPEGDVETQPGNRWRAVTLGGFVGLLSGLFGVGGGLLLVPGQVLWLGVPLKRAVGNSLGAVLLTGLVGTTAHARLGTVAWSHAWVLVSGGLVGVAVGARLLTVLPTDRLRVAMRAFIALLALAMAWRGLRAI
ncbi:MAG: sulfite exporter TauE/SafE family protein [Candidatus Sericytochromatia bacterium]|nr:sulfite exporter TauE/SafE family protein [Candidatus Sericytochromatia bacterium]